MVSCAHANRYVVVPAEEAGQRMGNARNREAPIENRGATTSARSEIVFGDSCVVDFVAQERATDGSKRGWHYGSHHGFLSLSAVPQRSLRLSSKEIRNYFTSEATENAEKTLRFGVLLI